MKRNRYLKNENYLFVDGYNIINSWESLKAISQISLEEARNKLIDILQEYSQTTTEKIILVFDAYLVKKSGGKIYKLHGIDVVYTKELESADHYIERELEEIGRLRRVRVATSDATEQEMILARGGTRISAREFEIEVLNSQKKTEKLAKKLREEKINPIDKKDLELLKELKKYLK